MPFVQIMASHDWWYLIQWRTFNNGWLSWSASKYHLQLVRCHLLPHASMKMTFSLFLFPLNRSRAGVLPELLSSMEHLWRHWLLLKCRKCISSLKESPESKEINDWKNILRTVYWLSIWNPSYTWLKDGSCKWCCYYCCYCTDGVGDSCQWPWKQIIKLLNY